MTREEEIKQAAKNRADQYEHSVDWNHCYHHYIQGAEWADQHPRKGLWDSEKVCDFIASHLTDQSIIKNWQLPYQTVQDFIDDLTKAMKD